MTRSRGRHSRSRSRSRSYTRSRTHNRGPNAYCSRNRNRNRSCGRNRSRTGNGSGTGTRADALARTPPAAACWPPLGEKGRVPMMKMTSSFRLPNWAKSGCNLARVGRNAGKLWLFPGQVDPSPNHV